MGNHTARMIDRTAQALLRIIIASYFIAVALGLIPGTDFSVLTALFMPAPFDKAFAMALVFMLAYLVMMGLWLRGAALTLGLMTFWSSYVGMISLGVSDELGSFWRDIALIAALMFTYGGPGSRCARCAELDEDEEELVPGWLAFLSRASDRSDSAGPSVAPDPNRPRDQVSVEEMMSMFRADFERARQK